MIFDANTNVGPTLYSESKFEFEPSFDALDAYLEDVGIEGAVVAPLKPPSFDFDRANARLAARIRDREQYRGIGRVDPRVENSATHARRAVSEYGLAGLKLHPWEESFRVTSDDVVPVLEVASAEGVPVWIHAGYPNVSHALSVRRLAQSHPEVPMVLTHSSQLDISGMSITDVMQLASATENTYFELSGVYRQDFIQEIIETVGSHRVFFGSNAPYFHPRVEKARVSKADIRQADKEKVLGESVRKLLE